MTRKKEEDSKTKKEELEEKLVDHILKDYQGENAEELFSQNGLIGKLGQKILEKAMQKELTHHLGYEKHSSEGNNSGNSRNGSSKKTLKSDIGEIPVNTPRDRNGTFEPQIVPKGKTHISQFDKLIISLYTKGMTTRDIQTHLKEMYKMDVSPDLISNVTDGVLEEIAEWQSRPLDKVYPIVYLDAIMIKIKDEGHIRNKAVYMVIGINMEGQKELLGLWIQQTEGAKFWMRVLTDLKNRGVEDIFIVCIDGLKGFPEAIKSIYPETEIQLCIVHLIRNSLKYVPYLDRKEIARDLKLIYGSNTVEQAEKELKTFADKWDKKYPSISKLWRNNWENISTFFAYDKAIRRAIYTTNVIESINYSLRKITKTRGAFPTEEAALKLLYMGIHKLSQKWTLPIRKWGMAINQFEVLFGERVSLYGEKN